MQGKKKGLMTENFKSCLNIVNELEEKDLNQLITSSLYKKYFNKKGEIMIVFNLKFHEFFTLNSTI